MSLRIACCTHRGSPYRQQDALLVDARVRQCDDWQGDWAVDGDGILIAVADGLASSVDSGFISRALLVQLAVVLADDPAWRGEGVLCNRHLRDAQMRLCAEAAGSPRMRRGAATTIVAAHVHRGRLVVLNCGDSRAYLRRADGEVRQLSRDHTELQRLIELGEAEAGVEYARFYDMLTDYICADPEEADFAIHRIETAWSAADCLVLCSDGVHDTLGEARWSALIGAARDPVELVATARAAVLEAGAPDNFTLAALAAAGIG